MNIVRPSVVVRDIEDACLTIVGAARVGLHTFRRKVRVEMAARQMRAASLATRVVREMDAVEQAEFVSDCASIAARYEELMAKHQHEVSPLRRSA